MGFVNDFVKNMSGYSLTSHKFWTLSPSEEVLKLDWNEATIPPCPDVTSAVNQLITNTGAQYYPDADNAALKKLIAEYSGLNACNIQYFAGSDAAHEAIARACLSEGCKVLMLTPTYDQFRVVCESAGAVVKQIPAKGITIEGFTSAISRFSPSLIYLCNPNNPTGELVTRSFVEKLALEAPNCLFLVDEAYIEFGGETCAPLVAELENIVVTRTFSKAFGLAGYRIGYLLGPPALIECVDKVRNAKSVTAAAQIAAITALNHKRYTDDYVTEVIKAREFFLAWLLRFSTSLGIREVTSGSGNFVLMQFRTNIDKHNFITSLEKYNIFVRDLGHLDSLSHAVRITVGTQAQMERVCMVFEGSNAP